MLDVRDDFPLLRNRPDLCYLDSAATSQKPDAVIEAVAGFLCYDNGTVRRGVHLLSDMAEGAYETAKQTIAAFIGADPCEIVFVSNATAAINTVARGYKPLNEGAVFVTNAEHNSNYLPWLHVGPVRMFDHLMRHGLALPERAVQFVAATHLSNVLGEETPVHRMADIAHSASAMFLVDAAQSIGHLPVNVKHIGCDFLAFSAHKMLSLTGLGVLFAAKHTHHNFAPVFVGGGTAKEIHDSGGYTWPDPPDGLEAGTPPIVEAVALKAAIDYLDALGMRNVQEHIATLTKYCNNQLVDEGIIPLGGPDKHGLVSFNVDDIHPHDVAFELDKLNIAVRGGHHCAHICHRNLGVKGSVRASFHVYNTLADVDRLIDGLRHVRATFGGTK